MKLMYSIAWKLIFFYVFQQENVNVSGSADYLNHMPAVVNITENSLELSDPREVSTGSNETSFCIIENISQRGKPKLFEKHGYSYNHFQTYGNRSKLY